MTDSEEPCGAQILGKATLPVASHTQPTCARPVSDRQAQPDWIGGGSESRQTMHAYSIGTKPVAIGDDFEQALQMGSGYDQGML